MTRQELGPTPLRAGRFNVLLKTVPTLSPRCVAASETQRTNNELSFRVACHTQPWLRRDQVLIPCLTAGNE